jgi:serine/threonine-protein kinase
MAFEKFRLCPATEAILTLLYNLALDYELKCNYAGAAMVYRHILTQQYFRDVEQRLEQLRNFKKSQLNHDFGDWLLDKSDAKPRLGRYQIERQLGKGAMGVVYLGKDTKLDRFVAIKTLALSHEFELEGLAEATARFFREANAAGRLRHPDIITIYDAGEQFDLAYIAMEFFKGGNLVPYTKVDNLLPIATVLEIGIRVAEALDYAQKQGVIHRDIKPANIMYNPATEQVKITDFGIAYITDAHKTKTGVVLGTPPYMSPEQFSGKLLTGGSDLFSLSVTLFQLLTG